MDWIAEVDVVWGTNICTWLLVSLFVIVDGGCTRQDDKEKLIVWERDGGKDHSCVMDVDDEEVMLEEVLQDLKGGLVSNVNQTLFIFSKARRCTCHYGHATVDQRSVGATWAIGIHIRWYPITNVGLRRIFGDSTDIEGCRQRRMVARISHNLLKGKMIVREQTLYGADPMWWRWKE